MSTKIYNAYLYNGTVEELTTWLFGLRLKHEKATLARMKEIFKPGARFGDVADLIRDHIARNLNTDINIKASAVIYLCHDKVYIQFFGLSELHIKQINKNPLFKDFHYQNQTDRPDEVSAHEWLHRKRTWDKILAHGDTPIENGLTFELLSAHFEYEVARHVTGRN